MLKNLLLKSTLLLCALFAGVNAWGAETATINFGSAKGSTKIDATSVTGDDSQGNTWTITTVTTSESFTQFSSYSQVGSSKKPATSITFTTKLPSEQKITAFSAEFGGFNGTAGNITLKVGDTTVGTGSLSGSTDVTVSSTSTTAATGTVLTITVTDIAKGVKCYGISYTYEAASDPSKTNVTLSFPEESYTVDKTDGFTAPTLTNPADVTVAYSSTDESVATVDATTGAVTLVNFGTTSIIASFEGDDNYNAASATYELNVDNHNHPYTVEEAIAAVDAESGTEGVYVKGYVSKAASSLNNDNSLTYFISDDGTTTNQFEIYHGKDIEGADFAAATDVQLGDEVVVYGDITLYGTTYEFTSGSTLISLKRKALTSLTLAGTYPTSFYVGDEFSNEGMVVRAAFDDQTTADVTDIATFTGYDMNTTGEQTVTVAYTWNEVEKTTSYTITVNALPKHQVTWSVNGETTTKEYTMKDAITFPTNPADVDGKTFVGWVATAIDGTTTKAPTFVTEATMGDADITYYAVFATKSTTLGEVTDVLTQTTTGITGSNYYDFENKTATSDAIYAGNCAGSNGNIQLRSNKSNSGIISTTSGGTVKKVSVDWSDGTQAKRTLNVYGSNTAYSSASDLYDEKKQGTLIGTIVKGTSTELTFTDPYQYIGLRSADGAMYFPSISITWSANVESYTDYCTTVTAVTSLTATITAAGYATWVPTENVAAPTGVSAFIVTSTSTSNVVMEELLAIPANTPVVLKGEAGSYTFDVCAESDLEANEADVTQNRLKVSDGTNAVGDGIYVLANKTKGVGFYPWTSNSSLSAGKVYLEISGGNARDFFGFGAETTGIERLQNGADAQVVFDLQGRSVKQPAKGLYIVNGKKVVIK